LLIEIIKKIGPTICKSITEKKLFITASDSHGHDTEHHERRLTGVELDNRKAACRLGSVALAVKQLARLC
jgi:hypothetical protein